ncbi:Trp biosynthesis-associated membrane protein [Nocardioides montaniterrae]
MAEARRTFGPVVLVGLAGAGMAAIGGHKTMLTIPSDYLTSLKAINPEAGLQGQHGVDFPLAGALALVTLAAWGAVLVTRGRFRRVVAALTALAAGGAVAALVVGAFVKDDSATRDLTSRLGASETVPLDPTGWMWVALAGAALSLVAAVAAVRFARSWPEMGTKYDAPAGAVATVDVPVEERSNLELWKSLDEGDDPTA